LLVQLHWDSAKAKLGLGVDLPIGEHYQKSIAQGKAGRRVVAAIEKAGRYYIRVYAKSYRDFSNYSLKAEFKAEGDVDGVKSVTIRCESCAQNERRCTADNRCKSCVPITPTCHLWLSLPSCGDKKKPARPPVIANSVAASVCASRSGVARAVGYRRVDVVAERTARRGFASST
jgi:hypothetical protein